MVLKYGESRGVQIDVDLQEKDRPTVFQHIIDMFGEEKTARVAAFGTLAERATIDDIGRCLRERFETQYGKDTNNPWDLKSISIIKKEYEADPENARACYPDLFYYFDGLFGTRVSQSVHPAGMVISSVTLDDNYGTFIKDGERCLFLDMDAAHDVNLIKYDLLILKTVQVISDTCKLIGIPYPRMHEIDFDDQTVWQDMLRSNIAIFQMESDFAGQSLRKFRPTSIDDITLVTAAIRPSGQSYRDRLLSRVQNVNPSPQMNDILKDNYGYLVYQEDILRFLMEVCGLSGGEADTVRRGIAKKKPEILEAALPKIKDGYCSHSDKPREEAEAEVEEILQIIEDASAYMFGRNHALGYSLLSYLCAYYRCYWPLEYITAFLNNAANDDDIKNGTKLAKLYGITVENPKWGISLADYYFNKEKNAIAKGLASVKYLSAAVAKELYDLSRQKNYTSFMTLLRDLSEQTTLDSRQLDILIKIDFFSAFGNQRELQRMVELFEMFKKGEAKQIKKTQVDGTPLEPIVQKYAVGTTKSGGVAKSYTLLDVMSILREAENLIKASNMSDLPDIVKVKNFEEAMGYVGYVSGKEEDRRKLFITDLVPLKRRRDGKQFGYSLYTKSIGSGVTARFTVFNRVFDRDPVKKGDIIYCQSFERDNAYFTLTAYEKIY